MSQETRGQLKKLKGRGKQALGVAVGDERMEAEGAAERAEGAAEEGIGKVRRKAGEAIEKIGESIKR